MIVSGGSLTYVTEEEIEETITYDPTLELNQVGPCHSPPGRVMFFWKCVQDLSTKRSYGRGTNC
jgi:hypothetical protein